MMSIRWTSSTHGRYEYASFCYLWYKYRGNRPCQCDDKCAEYGDCCIDAVPNLKMKGNNKWNCVPLNLNDSIYAISDCGKYKGQWKATCEKNVPPDKYHYILDIPVFSNLTRLYYANIYCAYCHDQLKFIVNPHLSVACSNNITVEKILETGIYQKGMLMWKVENSSCRIFPAEQLKNERPCVASVSNCPPDTDPILSSKCNSYSMILSKSKEMYKNPHCAKCNGINETELHCWYGYSYRTVPSLSMILSYDWSFHSCDVPESIWDGLQQKCTSVSCPIGSSCDINIKCNKSDMPCNNIKEHLSQKIDGYITLICMSTSVVLLFLHLLISVILPIPKTLPAKVLNSLAISLMVAQSLFLCGIFEVSSNVCKVIAVLTQFFYLASFFWMNAMSIDICNTFSDAALKNSSSKSHTKYAVYAWGGATLVTTSSVIVELTDLLPVDYRPHYAARPKVCWFGNSLPLAIFFYFPMFFLLLLNFMLFTITVYWLQRHHNSSEKLKTSGRKEYSTLWLYIKLSTIMGTSWTFGLLTSLTRMPIYHYPFTILNGLQGAFIFIMFDLKTVIVPALLKKIGMENFRNKGSIQGRSYRTNSSQLSSSSKQSKYQTDTNKVKYQEG
ncbi:G-protein coupled receptor Mth2 isoform X3 [Halyomorpha halys]|uniref:G-protein coupled receptor Mth2 isoform X3 n=1 Tax=Halyomorpha halys TaxID=286706 RepID=UPI0006D50847